MTRLYLCGKMTGLPLKNFPAFHAEAARLRALGYEVINPAELNPDDCTWLEAMRVDIAAMMTCDALATLPGSGKSQGASIEVNLAMALGFDVYLAPTLTEPIGEPYAGALVVNGVTQHYRLSDKEYSEEELGGGMPQPCTDRADLLKCLETGCRVEWKLHGMLTEYVKDDAGASRYGILTPRIAYLSGWTANRVSYHLRAAEKAGLVLSWKPYDGSAVRWWPVGLFDQMKAPVDMAETG